MFTSLLALILAVSTPCPTEDSYNCRWDATAHGTGTGSSFIVVGTEDAFTIHYDNGATTPLLTTTKPGK